MITNFNKFERLNEDINYHAFKYCGYYRADENQLISMTIELLANDIDYNYDSDKKILEIETFQFEKPYDIILKNGGEKLPFNLGDDDYEHNCVLLRSKPINVPDGAYM